MMKQYYTFIFLLAFVGKQSFAQKHVSFLPSMQNYDQPTIYGLHEIPILPKSDVTPGQPSNSSVGSTVYVDIDAQGANNGSTWADAFTNLQSAIDAAQDGDQIWIASGVYKPEIVNTPADSNFFLVDKPLEIFGGFAGNENSLDERDWEAYPVIASGDINGDDTDGDFVNNKSDNTIRLFHIVSMGVTMDGLEICYGQTRIGYDPATDPSPINFVGGGILDQGNSTIRNCIVHQNSGDRGGGIYSGSNGGLTVENCRFTNNHAVTFAGALNVGNHSATITDCSFESNTVEQGVGAAIFLWHNAGTRFDSSSVKIKNCDFNSNQAPRGAGIQFNNFSKHNKLLVDSCRFIANSTVNNGLGGAIGLLNYKAPGQSGDNMIDATITNSVFETNFASQGSGLHMYSNINGSKLILSKNVVKNNLSSSAGAVYVLCDNQSDMDIFMDYTSFDNNTSDFAGGAIVFNNAQSNRGLDYNLSNCQFRNNDGGDYAGAIFSFSSSGGVGPLGNMTNCNFVGNSAGLGCGAVSSNDENLILKNCRFEKNTAGNSASAMCLTVYSQNSGHHELENCQFIENATTEILDTSALWINNGALEIWSNGIQSTSLDSCLFEANTSPKTGGAVSILNEDSLLVSMTNCDFIENKAETGGALLSFGIDYGPKPTVLMDNCTFMRNVATLLAGGVMISNSDVHLANSLFDENESAAEGGNLAISNGSATIFDNVMVKGGKAIYGGGIEVYQNKVATSDLYCKFINTKFIENESSQRGGAFLSVTYVKKSFIEFDSCQFVSNQSSAGGAIYNLTRNSITEDHEANMSIKNSIFEYNTAQSSGGAVLNSAEGDTLNFYVDSCIFRNNSSLRDHPSAGGAGILNAGVGEGVNLFYNIRNTLFEENQSSGISGGIWNSSVSPDQGTQGTVYNCRFIDNYAKHCCGGLGVAYNYGVYENCYFEGNSTSGIHPSLAGGGGAGFVLNKSIDLINTVFVENTSEQNGAALHLSGDGVYRLENIEFRNHEGDALYADAEVEILNNTLRNNEVGIASNSNAEISLQNNVFDNEINWIGAGMLESNGGNISSDMSMNSVLTNVGAYADLNGQDPLLGDDGVPTANSRCVDGGNPDGINTTKDAAGKDRIQGSSIDIGAYESPFIVAVKEAVWDSELFSVYPNPVERQLLFDIKDSDFDLFQVQIFTSHGQLIFSELECRSKQMDVNSLLAGQYYIVVTSDQRKFAAKFIKS